MKTDQIPVNSYGVLKRDQFDSEIEELTEEIKRVGFSKLDSGFNAKELKEIAENFDNACNEYLQSHGETRLRAINEFHTIRALLTHGDGTLLKVATNKRLLALIGNLIEGKFILNQQNGITNPPRENYNQAAWHRDLPYQHFTSSSPLAVNALFCIDDFTKTNGSTFVLPASHKSKSLPSSNYLRRHAYQLEAKAGQYILLDSMLFHSGGVNSSDRERRAINNVYSIPYFKQQIKLPGNINRTGLSPEEIDLLGCNYQEPNSVEEYLDSRCNEG